MPVDSDFFDKTNPAQMVWYQVQYFLDEQEKYELLRDVAEHNAMFWNPEGVNQIRDARKNKYEMPQEDFSEFIKGTFGRDIDFEGKRDLTEQDVEGTDFSPYMNLELDDIKFTPFGG